MKLSLRIAAGIGGLVILTGLVVAARLPKPPAPSDAPAEPLVATEAGLLVPQGWTASVYVPSERVKNPVALATDERGRLFVVESQSFGPNYVTSESLNLTEQQNLNIRTTAQRKAIFAAKSKRSPDWPGERVMVHETDPGNPGRGGSTSVFADGFKEVDTEIASGVLVRRGTVWFADLPTLWKLGSNGTRTPLSTGYGLRIGMVGHSLHGLAWGPDGKLYYSLGDIGADITAGSKHLYVPDSGSVFRCDPDGGNLELFATGLRNPQDLAFDDFGNLFTGDNDQDPGDESRFVHIVEGGDSGWRPSAMLSFEKSPWMREKIWEDRWPGQPACYLPPVATLPTCLGPSGLRFAPGTGLPPEWENYFFLCNFGYVFRNSGVQGLKLAPEGASFKLERIVDFARNVVPADLEFAPEGGLLIADWGDGGQPGGSCRILRMIHPEFAAKAQVREAAAFLASDIPNLPEPALLAKLGHANRRVRQEAQFELAARGKPCVSALLGIARNDANRLARVHAIWALGQIERTLPGTLVPIVDLLTDSDMEIRTQSLRVLGDARIQAAETHLPRLLADPQPRVRAAAAVVAAKLKSKTAMPAVFAMLRADGGQDPYLRHAGVMALVGADDAPSLSRMANDADAALRLAAVLAYRRLGRVEVADLLTDTDERVAVEAARAVHDGRILGGFPKLAALAINASLPDALIRRSIHANRILGRAENAKTLAAVALGREYSRDCREMAIRSLLEWANPAKYDFVTGVWWDLPPRNADFISAIAAPLVEPLLHGNEPQQLHAINLCRTWRIAAALPALAAAAGDAARSVAVRSAALSALVDLDPAAARTAAKTALAEPTLPPVLRVRFLAVTASNDPEAAAAAMAEVFRSGKAAEQQEAWTLIRNNPHAAFDAVVRDGMTRLLAGTADPATELELLAAARARPAAADLVKAFDAAIPASRTGKRHASLMGGDPVRGKELFSAGSTETTCVRCHSVLYQVNGGIVGPNLAGVAGRLTRDKILESIVEPNAVIAPGYDSVILSLLDGSQVSGSVVREDANTVVVRRPDGQERIVPVAEIESRKAGLSAMPDGLADTLSDRDLRDLVAYLATLEPRGGAMFAVRRLREKLPPRGPVDAFLHGLP